MMKFKDEGVDGNVKGVDYLLKKNKIELVARHRPHRRARQGRGDGATARPQTLETKNIVIATGSDVRRCAASTSTSKRIVSSTGALALDEVPQRLLVIGAGVIGLELGSVWRRLGSAGDGGRIPRPHPARAWTARSARQSQRLLEQAGHDVQAFVQGHRRRRVGTALKATVEPAAGRRQPRRSRPTSCWSRSVACPTPTASVSKTSASSRTTAAASSSTRTSRTNVAGHLCDRRRDRRPDAGAQGRGRGRGRGGDPRRPGRPRELRRDPERGLHRSRRSPRSARPRTS